MYRCTTYNPDTGEITGNYVGRLRPPQPHVDGSFSHKEYRIVDGQAVKKTQEEIQSDEDIRAIMYLRSDRDALLQASDWTQVPDAPVDKAAWAAYRQELRDLPQTTTDPKNPTWPVPPQ